MTSFTSRSTLISAACAVAALWAAPVWAACDKPLYLTFESGGMDVAQIVVDVLNRQQVPVTFVLANEPAVVGGTALSNTWSRWWQLRAAEGHEFVSMTYDKVYWLADDRSIEPRFRVRPTAGALANREFTWDAKKYCEQVAYGAERIHDQTGKVALPLFRAPGGQASPKLMTAVRACGYAYVGWSPSGVLGDNLPSERFSNATLLNKALHDIKSGDILLGHLGSDGRKDAWAPVALEPLLVGLKERGFCFQTLREHPDFSGWIQQSQTPGGKP